MAIHLSMQLHWTALSLDWLIHTYELTSIVVFRSFFARVLLLIWSDFFCSLILKRICTLWQPTVDDTFKLSTHVQTQFDYLRIICSMRSTEPGTTTPMYWKLDADLQLKSMKKVAYMWPLHEHAPQVSLHFCSLNSAKVLFMFYCKTKRKNPSPTLFGL